MDLLAEALELHGWEVHIALAQGQRFHRPSWYLERHPFQRAIALDDTHGFREGRVLRLLQAFESVRPAVIVPVNLADALHAAAMWKQGGNETRLVTCVHGQNLGPLRDIETYASFIDQAVAVSMRAADELHALSSLTGRVAHIPTGVPAPLVPPPPRSLLANIGYVGRLDVREKRAADLVPLAKLLRGSNVRLHIVGDGPDAAAILGELVEPIRSGAVVYHATLTRDRLYEDIYPALDALLIFSESEGGPIAAWEAMIHGVVPVVSDFSGRLAEGVIRHAYNSLVFPVGDVEAATNAVLRLRDGTLLRTLSENARNELPDRYRFEGFAAAWATMLRSVLTRPIQTAEVRLPRAVSSGGIARLGLGEHGSFRLRRLLRRQAVHQDPGSEWPHSYSPDGRH